MGLGSFSGTTAASRRYSITARIPARVVGGVPVSSSIASSGRPGLRFVRFVVAILSDELHKPRRRCFVLLYEAANRVRRLSSGDGRNSSHRGRGARGDGAKEKSAPVSP
jgi:hypothetical protein